MFPYRGISALEKKNRPDSILTRYMTIDLVGYDSVYVLKNQKILIMTSNFSVQIQRSPCLNALIMSSIEKSFSSELCGKIIFFIAGILCSLLADDLKTSPLFGSIIMFPIWCTKLSGKRREGLKSLDNWFGCTCKIHRVGVIMDLFI